MKKRITLVSLFDKETLIKLNDLTDSLNERTCKVPYHNNIKNREIMDTLPFHFTVSAWNGEDKQKVINLLKDINFVKLKFEIDQVKIMSGKENSYVLYLSMKENKNVSDLQKILYDKLPSEKYNPDKFIFHITLHIDRDYEKVLAMQQSLNKNFRPFVIEVCKLGLFEIYPAELVYIMNSYN